MQDKNPPALISDITARLFRLQEELFTIGAELALAPQKNETPLLTSAQLEKEIDEFWAQVPPLRNFILPGGHLANSQAHICRVVCRRSERLLWELSEIEAVRPTLLVFFNRLSDWFFVICRIIHHAYNIEELIWKGRP